MRRNNGYTPRALAAAVAFFAFAFALAARADIQFPPADHNTPLEISADRASRWQEGKYEVLLLHGNCRIAQDKTVASGRDAVLWIDHAPAMSLEPNKVIAYLEGDLRVQFADGRLSGNTQTPEPGAAGESSWVGRFHTNQPVQLRLPVAAPQPPVKPPIYERSLVAHRGAPDRPVQAAQFTAPIPGPGVGPPPPNAAGMRRIQIFPRTSTRVQGKWFPSPVNDEWVGVIDSGVNVIVDGVGSLGQIDVSTDRIVIWTRGIEQLNLEGQSLQQGDVPFEIYMEGNIVFRQGDRVIYAERMYYNVSGEYGVVLDAEMLTPVPQYLGLIKLKADILQQINRQQFQAFGGALTSSRMGGPRYWLQSRNVTFEDIQEPIFDPFTGQPAIDPVTQDVAIRHELLATSRNNFFYLGGVPVLWWPVLATDLTDPTFYITSVSFGSDRVFGDQAGVNLNLYQLFGWRNPPQGTKWTGSVDWMSDRGLGVGTIFEWSRTNLFGLPGPYRGFIDAWGLQDRGLDVLGSGRNALLFDSDYRGRIRGRHRHTLPNGFQLTAELGLISDRNFLEEYYLPEWDQQKDQTTGIELKQYLGINSWSVTADYNPNDFFTQTNNLPRADHFLIGQSLLGDRLTWHAHSQIGYAQLKIANLPTTAVPPSPPSNEEYFTYLGWERELGSPLDTNYGKREGLKAVTRHELDLPLQVGPVKVVPYALGEIAYWEEGRVGEWMSPGGLDLTRAYGQGGVRASMPMWKADPTVQSTLMNMNGLAHKIVFDAELTWADASQNLTQLPLYEPLDDDSSEHFERRFQIAGGTFFGVPDDVLARYDNRYFALRTGMQGNVTAPSAEIADDMLVLRGGIRQRWQTKRGLPGQQRIIDWIVFDVNASYFPKPELNPFGDEANLEPFAGLIDYNFQWHVGDRVSLVSDGFFDTFGGGLRTMSVGGFVSRPERGRLYLGYRWFEGPFTSNVVSAAVSYRMSEKWAASYAANADLADTGAVGHRLRITRIGESFLLGVGFSYSSARDDVGLSIVIEPRFMSPRRLQRVAGVAIQPAGVYGLE